VVFDTFAQIQKIRERLIRLSNELIRRIPTEFSRYIKTEIDWEDQLIGISGARGCGKTIMLLQYLKKVQKSRNAIYASLDDIYFSKNKLWESTIPT